MGERGGGWAEDKGTRKKLCWKPRSPTSTSTPVPGAGLRAAPGVGSVSPPEELEMLRTASFPCKRSGPALAS